MNKLDIYMSIVRDAVTISRNRSTLPFWERIRRGVEYYELELAHGIFPCLNNSEFDSADRWFLENIATWYVRHCTKEISPNYLENLKRLSEICSLAGDQFCANMDIPNLTSQR